MIKKRLMKLTATALALTLALTACSSGSSGTASTAAAQTSNGAQETPSDLPVITPSVHPTLPVSTIAFFTPLPSFYLH